MKYLLIWSVNDYEELGGGTFFKRFESGEEMDEKVNELVLTYKEKLIIDASCLALVYFEYEAKEVITKMERVGK